VSNLPNEHCHDLYDGGEGEEDALLAERLAEMWRCRFAGVYPDLEFLAKTLSAKRTCGEIVVRFHTIRSEDGPSSGVPSARPRWKGTEQWGAHWVRFEPRLSGVFYGQELEAADKKCLCLHMAQTYLASHPDAVCAYRRHQGSLHVNLHGMWLGSKI